MAAAQRANGAWQPARPVRPAGPGPQCVQVHAAALLEVVRHAAAGGSAPSVRRGAAGAGAAGLPRRARTGGHGGCAGPAGTARGGPVARVRAPRAQLCLHLRLHGWDDDEQFVALEFVVLWCVWYVLCGVCADACASF